MKLKIRTQNRNDLPVSSFKQVSWIDIEWGDYRIIIGQDEAIPEIVRFTASDGKTKKLLTFEELFKLFKGENFRKLP